MRSKLHEGFIRWCAKKGINLQSPQETLAHVLLSAAETEDDLHMLLDSGPGAGKTFAFEAVVQFMAEMRRERQNRMPPIPPPSRRKAAQS